MCQAWQWRQSNGALRDMVRRGLLLILDHAARESRCRLWIYVRHNPLPRRTRPVPALIDITRIAGPLRYLEPLHFQVLRRTAEEPLLNSLMEQHHYLCYT